MDWWILVFYPESNGRDKIDENIQIKLIYTKYLLVAIGYWQSSLNK
jgi:hypothetical protein